MMVDSGTEEEDFLMEALGQPSVEEEEDSETEEMEFEPTSGYSGDRAEEERAGKVAAKRKLKGDYSPGDGRKRQRSGRGSRRSSTVLQDSFPRFYAPRLPEDCSSLTVEKIIAMFPPKSDAEDTENLFLVKFKGLSYLHLKLVKRADILSNGTASKKKFQQFVETNSEPTPWSRADFIVPSVLKEIDRILAAQDVPLEKDSESTSVEYFVKWKGLTYSESTWEYITDLNKSLGEDVVRIALDRFLEINSAVNTLPRQPDLAHWKPISESPEFKFPGQELRPWQIEGLNWLIFNCLNQRGSILADEMGLGKTLQTIICCQYLNQNFDWSPVLVVAPISTLPHWKSEIETWTDLNAVVYHGTKQDRELIRFYEWKYWNSDGTEIPSLYKFDVLILSYEIILSDTYALSQIPWKVLVVDEAHRLKNWQSKLNVTIRENFKYDYAILLTGTPVQNNISELWGLLNIADQKKFPVNDRKKFLLEFSGSNPSANKLDSTEGLTQEHVLKLQNILKPYMLRRLKGDVAGEAIPPKEETVIECELTTLQKQYYRAVLEKNKSFLYAGCSSNNVPQLQNIAMQLRKVCNHPFLLEGVENKVLRERSAFTVADVANAYVESSGKFILLDKLLPKLKADGHRVLIFSQLKIMLDILEYYLNCRGYSHVRIDGDTSPMKRQACIDIFCAPDSECFVFLLATRAGGVGINLAAADTVIIFDSDWNPQNDVQAQARAHRIGQTSKVQVYRLITSKSYEKQMFIKASLKLGLDQAVLSNISESATDSASAEFSSSKKLSGEEIDQLLKYGAYDILNEDEGSSGASEIFAQQDIDEILEKRSTVVRIEDNRSSTGFSKATFVLNETDDQVDVNAPDFWEKILPDKDSVTYLMGIAQEASSSDAFTEKYFQILNDRVTDVLSHADAFSEDKRLLLDLLRLLSNLEFISAEQKSKCMEWQEAVENPRRHRRIKESKSSEELKLSQTESSMSIDDKTSKGDNTGSSRVKTKKTFSMLKTIFLDILKDVLVSFIGTGRLDSSLWADTELAIKTLWQEHPDFSSSEKFDFDISDLQKLSVEILTKCRDANPFEAHLKLFDDTYQQLRNEFFPGDDSIILTSRDFSNPGLLSLKSGWLQIDRKISKLWATPVRVAQSSRKELDYIEKNPDLSFSSLNTSDYVAHWWSKEDDWKLLKGFSIYGAHPRVYPLLFRDDENVGFNLWSRSNDSTYVPSKASVIATNASISNPMGCVCHSVEVFSRMISCCECGKFFHEECVGIPSLFGKQSFRFWFCPTCRTETPNPKLVEVRGRHFLDNVSRIRFYEMRRLAAEQRESSRIINAKIKQDKIDSIWNKKEKRTFRRLLHCFGDHRWDRFIESNEFGGRCADKLAEYFENYFIQCTYMMLTSPVSDHSAQIEKYLSESKLSDHCYCICETFAGVGISDMMCCERCLSWFHKKCLLPENEDSNCEKKVLFLCEKCDGVSSEPLKDFASVKKVQVRNEIQSEPMPFCLVKCCRMIMESIRDFVDLSIVNKNLTNGSYFGLQDFAEDIRLLFRSFYNLKMTDGSCSWEFEDIEEFSDIFERSLNRFVSRLRQPSFVDQYVSLAMALKTIERVEFFDNLNDVFSDDWAFLYSKLLVLSHSVSAFQNDFLFLPSYWRPEFHDSVLILAVYSHGLGSVEQALNDPKIVEVLKLASSDSQIGVSLDVQKDLFRELLEDKPPLWKRLVFIVDLIRKGVRGSPSDSSLAETVELEEVSSTPAGAKLETILSSPTSNSSMSKDEGNTLLDVIDPHSISPSSPNHESLNSENLKSSNCAPLLASVAMPHMITVATVSTSNGPIMAKTASPTPALQVSENRTISNNVVESDVVNPLLTKGGATILSLGRIVSDRRRFHQKNYIWPVGFKSVRFQTSYKDPSTRIQYISEIKDAGDIPIFFVYAEDDRDDPILHVSATGAWSAMMERIYAARGQSKDSKIGVSGPELFGFGDPKIKKLIEELPGAASCTNYKANSDTKNSSATVVPPLQNTDLS